MGCDIHCFVEELNDVWEIVPAPTTETEYRWPLGERDGPWEVGEYRSLAGWLDARNYELFYWMAEVRYGYLAAYEPRGIPVDASPEYREEVDDYWGDGHSHSWLTIKELAARSDVPELLRELVDEVILVVGTNARLVFFFDS